MNHRPSFCIINTVLISFSGRSGFRISPRLPNTKLTFQEKAAVSSFRFDVSTHSTATLYSSKRKPTARHLVRVRREHALNGSVCVRCGLELNSLWRRQSLIACLELPCSKGYQFAVLGVHCHLSTTVASDAGGAVSASPCIVLPLVTAFRRYVTVCTR